MEIQWAFALAGFGGFIRYIQRFAGPKESRPPLEYGPLAVALLTGGFVGILTLWLVGQKIDLGYLCFAVAIAGYGGPLTLDFFWESFRDALKRSAEKPKDGGPKV